MLHLASAIATKTPSVYLLTKSVVTPELLSVRGCMVSEQKILLCKAQQEVHAATAASHCTVHLRSGWLLALAGLASLTNMASSSGTSVSSSASSEDSSSSSLDASASMSIRAAALLPFCTTN